MNRFAAFISVALLASFGAGDSAAVSARSALAPRTDRLDVVGHQGIQAGQPQYTTMESRPAPGVSVLSRVAVDAVATR